jgi:DNA-binding LytR/AlgR family response regulator
LEAQLDSEQFLRISRSAIVNLDRIQELQPTFKGEQVVVLQNGRQLSRLARCALPQVRRRLILGIVESRGIQRRP